MSADKFTGGKAAAKPVDGILAVDDFERSSNFSRSMTMSFIAAVPEVKWHWSPAPSFAPISKQVRHLVCIQGVYNDGFLTRKADFSRKHDHYVGGLDKESLTAALKEKSARTTEILFSFREHGTADFRMDFFGDTISWIEYCHVMLQHEAIHHGQWSL